MKKVKYLSLGIIVVIAMGISGCNKNTQIPQVYHDKARQTGIVIIPIGVDKNLEINITDTYEVELINPEKYHDQYRINGINKMGRILHKWKELNVIYRDEDDCLVDRDNTGFFTHDEEEDSLESLDKLDVPIGYKILPTRSIYSEIKEPQIYHDQSKATGRSIIRIPALNAIKTVEIGENIYQKINQYSYDTYGIVLTRPENISDNNWTKTNEGINSKALFKWTTANYNTICTNGKKRCLVDVGNKNIFTYDIMSDGDSGTIDRLNSPIEYKVIPTPATYDEDSFKYQALYQGRIGNKIKISFREFKDDMSRPAFTQDIEYELDKNGEAIIGFKGLRVKILKATNMNVTYSVIQDYN